MAHKTENIEAPDAGSGMSPDVTPSLLKRFLEKTWLPLGDLVALVIAQDS